MIAGLGVDPQRLSGTDPARRVRMYSPQEYAPGSSVSHYTVDTRPSQLMERWSIRICRMCSSRLGT
ncbi:hypothetical protein LP419_04305 [Massilia sp. H-1]|nr:hypothetical protein LP419_04305 [Massilia sp. H-1]